MKDSQTIAREWSNLTDNIAVHGRVVTPEMTRNALRVLLEEKGWSVPVSLIEIEPIDGQTRHAKLQVGKEQIEVRFQGDGGFSHAMLSDQSSLFGLKRKGELRRLHEDEEGVSPELLSILFRACPNSTEEQWGYILDVIADAPHQDEDPSYWYVLNTEALKQWAKGTHHSLNARPIGFSG